MQGCTVAHCQKQHFVLQNIVALPCKKGQAVNYAYECFDYNQ